MYTVRRVKYSGSLFKEVIEQSPTLFTIALFIMIYTGSCLLLLLRELLGGVTILQKRAIAEKNMNDISYLIYSACAQASKMTGILP